MDEMEKRLREATDNCLKAHESWRTDQRNTESREKLMECVHELRKIAARLEIEIAISERDAMGSRPIPIPPHRSARKQGAEGMEEEDNSVGNRSENGPPQGGFSSGGGRSGGVEVSRMGGGRRPQHHRRHGGGGGGEGGGGQQG